MTLENLAYLAEIIGVIAIVASLVFVGIQIKQNTTQSKIAASEAVHRSTIDIYSSVSVPEVNRAFIKAQNDMDSLTQEERALASHIAMKMLINLQDIYYKSNEDSLLESRRQFWDGISALAFTAPFVKTIFIERSFLFSDDFKAYAKTKMNAQATLPKNAAFWLLDPVPTEEDAP